ncbi:hypothetical protein F5X97DRAFT_326093 [Nemania serpens]|nr:hypothetical protein F5X97DRAFT_326093 [Nemania serpens]
MSAKDLPNLKVSATLRLDPSTYSLSSEPPTLHLEVTSHYYAPITILADNLSLHWMLSNGTALVITDLSNNRIVEQRKRIPSRTPPPPRYPVSVMDWQLHTLFPGQPLLLSGHFSVPFKQSRENYHPGQGCCSEIDRSPSICAHPLIPGRRYKVSLSGDEHMRWDRIRWWQYGTKDELLDGYLDGREVTYGDGPHGSISIDTSRIDPIVFECAE